MANGKDSWRELSRRPLCDYGVFRSTERINEGPHGKAGRFIVLEAPDWAVVVPVIVRDKRRFLVTVEQYRHGADECCAEFPGGVVEPGEEPAAAAARELLEETGWLVGRIVPLGSCWPNPAIMSNRLHVFAAEELEATGRQDLDEHELVDVRILPEDEVLASMGTPPWSHALMATAAWYYARYRDAAMGR